MIKCNLRVLLAERNMKMSELADAAGISRNALIPIYHERAKGITYEMLDKLCQVLDCEPGDLLKRG